MRRPQYVPDALPRFAHSFRQAVNSLHGRPVWHYELNRQFGRSRTWLGDIFNGRIADTPVGLARYIVMLYGYVRVLASQSSERRLRFAQPHLEELDALAQELCRPLLECPPKQQEETDDD